MVVEEYRLVWLLKPGAPLRKDIPNPLVLLIPRSPHCQCESGASEGAHDMLVMPSGFDRAASDSQRGDQQAFCTVTATSGYQW
ncbi:hypothetical protein HPB50_016217 [Hyalomma asiaticum]|uniref:Uncharacterized protein n=1 Tax=Hyalomma asiaticum TaxID=266040 RepID=A0ACB7SD45_HYAAI|nr:hypothetical protein HPB50_016217 [Hyalomma asiaticum]